MREVFDSRWFRTSIAVVGVAVFGGAGGMVGCHAVAFEHRMETRADAARSSGSTDLASAFDGAQASAALQSVRLKAMDERTVRASAK